LRIENEEVDKWVLARDKAKEELIECQKNKKVQSCLKCLEIIGCEIRNEYVKRVYESMNKGQGGGFEF